MRLANGCKLLRNMALLSLVTVCSARQGFAQFNSSGAEQLSRGGAWDAPTDGDSVGPVSPPNGDIVVFASSASNLVSGDTNGFSDVFQYTPDKKIELISVAQNPAPEGFIRGSAGPAISNILPDGTYAVAFTSDAPNIIPNYLPPPGANSNPRQVYLRFPKIGKTILVSVGQQSTGQEVIGANDFCDQVSVVALADPKRFIVAFRSAATNLTESPPERNVATIVIVRIEFNPNGEPVIRRVDSPNRTPDGAVLSSPLNHPVLNGDGRLVAFSSVAAMDSTVPSTGGKEQVYVFDHAIKAARMISRDASGAPGNDHSVSPSISYQGDFVAFISRASNLVPRGDNNPAAYLFSAPTKKITRVNTSGAGVPSNGKTLAVSISPSGKLVSFSDDGSNLSGVVPAGIAQTYIKDPISGSITLTSSTPAGAPADGNSGIHTVTLATGETQVLPSLSFGALGFNNKLIFNSFASVAQNLKFTPSNDSFANVYRTSITPPKPKLTKNVPIEAPPDITITSPSQNGSGATVVFQLQEFDSSSTSSFTTADGRVAAAASSSAKLEYKLEIRKVGATTRIFRTSSRNTVTVRKLATGTYNVRYRVVKTSGKTTTKSKYSPTASLQIS